MNTGIDDYIKNQLIQGKSEEEIRRALLENGWDKNTVTYALRPYKKSTILNFFTLPTKFNKKPVAVSMLVFLLGIMTLSIVYGYLYYYLDPQRIFSRSLSNFSYLNAYSFSGTLRAEYDKPKDDATLQVPISFSSAFTGRYANAGTDGPKYDISFTANAGNVNVAQLDAKKIASKVYFYPKQLSDLGFINNERVLNRWIEIDLTTIPLSFPSFLSVFSQEISVEQKKELVTQLSENPPLMIITKLPDEEIEGVLSYHYLYTIRKDNLVSFLKAHHNGNLSEIESFFSQLEFKNGEIWIARKGNYPSRMTILFVRSSVEKNAPALNVALDIRLKDVGSHAFIDIPESATPLSTLIQEITAEFNNR